MITNLKTLVGYANEVAALINGKVIYTGPSGAVVNGSCREISLDGPRVPGWHLYNQTLIAKLKAGESIENIVVDQ